MKTNKLFKGLVALFAMVLTLVSVQDTKAQIAPVSYNFDVNISGWTGTTGAMLWTNALPCSGGGSLRRNVYTAGTQLGGTGNPPTALNGGLTSPALAGSNGLLMTVAFDYKVTNWSAGTVATPANWGTLVVQYGSSATGPWTSGGTINAGFTQHAPSTTCTTRVVTFTPPAGTVHVRFVSTFNAGDYWLYIDNVNISQVAGGPCTGTPAPGNTLASAAAVCSGSSVNLSLQNATTGSGVSYQWQSGPTNVGPWTNVGASSSTFSPTVTAATWYRCQVTCSTGPATGTSNPVQVTLNQFFNCYASSAATNAGDTEILNVTVGSMNNTSTCFVAATGPGSVLSLYANYRGVVAAPNLARTTTVTTSINRNTCGGTYTKQAAIWIDYNQDGVFADPAERVVLTVSDGINGPTAGSFVVPLGAALGTTGMRVVLIEGIPAPTGSYAWGETEDYLVNITAAPACAPPSALTATGITATGANLSWTGAAGNYDVEWGTFGFVPTGTPSVGFDNVVNSGPHALGGLSGLTQYSYYVRQDCGGSQSSWTGPFSFGTACGTTSCNYIARLTDSFGDGWNGALMTVSQNGVVVATVGPTFTTGTGPVDVTVPICEGVGYTLNWTTGGAYSTEVGIQLIDAFGGVLYTKAPGVGSAPSLLFSGTGLCTNPLDIAPIALAAPSAGGTCGGGSVPVQVTIRNTGTSTINFAVNPVTVNVVVTGPIGPQNLSVVVNTGTLASNTNLNVTTTANADLSAQGTYTFAISAVLTGDSNPANNTLAPNPTRTVSSYAGLFPYTQQFGATPNPVISSQIVTLSGTSGFADPAWTISTTGNTALPTLTPTNAGFATFNSYNCYIGASARLVMPCMDFSSMGTPQVRFRMSQDNGFSTSFETVTLQYSTNGGATWVSTISQQRVITGVAQWTEFTVPLCVLSGNSNVRLGFLGTSFYGNNVHIDEIIIEDAGACPIPALAAVTGLTSTTATLNWSNLAGCGVTGYDFQWGTVGNVTANSVPGLLTNTYTISAGLTSGTTYEYRVRSSCGGPTSAYSVTGTFTVPFAVPANDNCATPSIITPAITCVLGGSSLNGYTNASTASGPATPICSGFTGNPDDDVWYAFQANGVAGTNYRFTLTPVGPSFDGVIAVYQNNGCVAPTLVQCVNATFGGAAETMIVPGLIAGTIYKVRVYSRGTGVATEGQFNLCIQQIPPPPANDDCAGAILLTSQPNCVPTAGTTDWSTTSVPATVCGGTADDDVWYSFVATSTTHEITVVGDAQMNPVVQLFSGAACVLTSLTCVDLSLDGGTEVINAAGLFPGSTYYVRVYDYDAGYSATPGFTICVTDVNVLTPPPANDNCASGTLLTSAPTCVTTSHTTAGATNITALPGNLCGSGVGNADDDVWFNFVCTNSSQIIDVQSGPALDAVVELRTNACNGSLISCADATGVAGLESLQVNGLTVGTTYKIRVYGRGAGQTTQDVFDICVYHGVAPAAPANDNCAGAVLLSAPASPACVLTPGTVLGATSSTPASVCIGTANDDVWYKFNAGANTAFNVTVVGSAQFDAVIQVLGGGVTPGNCGTLTSINCTDISGAGGTEVANLTGLTPGNTYFIRVYDYGAGAPATSTFQICVNFIVPPPPPINDNCSGAITLIPGGTCSPTAGTVSGATASGTATVCAGTPNDDVWYKWVATSTIHKVQLTTSSGFAGVVQIYTSTGACASIAHLACGNATIIGTPVVVTLPGLTIGTTYYIRVYDFFATAPATPTFSICVITIPAPPIPTNDLCANAIGVACGDLITGQNSNGGTSGGDPIGVCGTDMTNTNSIWYRVTGNGNSYEVNTCNFNGYDTKVAIFSGTCLALTCIGGNDDTPGCGNGLASSVTWQTVNGVDYYIMVGGYLGQQGIFQLQVNCCNAATIGGTTTVTPDPAVNVVNNAFTFGVASSNGAPTQWQFSLNNFTTVAGTFTANGPTLTLIDNVNGTIWIRAVMSAGAGCLPVNSSNLAVTPICASSITGQPQNTGAFITNFQLGSLNNNSTYDSFDMYQNFTNLAAVVQRGLSYQMKIKTNGAGSYGRMVWIDYNNDGDFLDAGENAITPQAPSAGVSTHIITIPCVGTGPIEVKCRVLICNTTPNVNPCAAVTYTNGEIEEYLVKIDGAGFGTWTGLVSNQWSDPNNWACLQVPNASTNVVFPVGAPNVPAQLTGASVCKDITFNTAGPFFVSPGLNLNGNTLSVKGDFYVSGSANASAVFSCNGTIDFNGTLGPQNVYGRPTFGNVTINNTAGVTLNNPTGVQCILKTTAGVLTAGNFLTLRSSLTATALIDPTGTGSVAGNVTVQRKIGATSGYHYLSSPVAGSVVNNPANGWSDDFIITPSFDNFPYDPTVPAFSTFPQVWEYDETNPSGNPAYGWIGATNGDLLLPLKGFACVVPAGTMVDVYGVVNNGPISSAPTFIQNESDGLNLLGNPYPSPISWNQFRAHNPSLSATYQVFATTGGYAGNYLSWNGTSGAAGNIISSSQAFFVTAVLDDASVNAINTDRTTDVNPTFYSNNVVPNQVKMEVNGMGTADATFIYFDPINANGFDVMVDGQKILPTQAGIASIYSVVDNHILSINAMGALNQDFSIPLGVKIQTAGTYDLTAADLSSMSATSMIYLEDVVTGSMINLRETPVYTVNLAPNDYTNRFYLHFHPALDFNGNGETCVGNDGTIGISYPSTSTVNVSVKNSAGVVVSTLNNFNGTTTISNLSSGNYIVVVEYAGGFTTTDYVQVAAGNAVAANMTASTQSVDLSNNSSVVFTATANGATSYNWNFGDGTVINNGPANVSHLFTAAGVYDVTFEATNSICSSVAHASVTVLNPTGIVSNNAEGVKVFGTENRVSVQFGSIADGKGRIEVLNMLGQSVVDVEVNTTKGTREIEVPNNAVGHYMVRVTTANKVYTQKVYLTK